MEIARLRGVREAEKSVDDAEIARQAVLRDLVNVRLRSSAPCPLPPAERTASRAMLQALGADPAKGGGAG